MLRRILLYSVLLLTYGAGSSGVAAQDRAARGTVPKAVDGGAVRMPEVRQRILVREDSLWAEALRIHYNALIVDGHIDTPSLMLDDDYDFGVRHRSLEAHVDLPRLFEGGLDAPFFSIYVGAGYGEGAAATQRARDMVAEVKRQVAAHPDSAEMAYSAADVRRIARAGRKAVLMGLEGGHALAGSAEVLGELQAVGIRYVTLTHVNTNSWADASQTAARWNGLNDLGRSLVREMNRLGVLVDLSHVSDSTFYDALEVSQVPVILSHSSMRALTDVARNIDDAMLRALAANGGVVMINYYEPMVNPHLRGEVMDEVYRRLGGRTGDLRLLWQVAFDVRQEQGLGPARLSDVVDHIDHAIQVAGIDHVGLGSDFDGARMPPGFDDVTRLPWITYSLLKRGYTEEDLYKVLGGNALRVLEAAERFAQGR
jgi:membrane dipeptidase